MNSIDVMFKDWACSFSGCDGGNPEGDWFCGIEFGTGDIRGEKDHTPEEYEQSVKNYYLQELNEEIQAGPVLLAKSFNLSKNTQYPFGLKLAKLYAVIKGNNLQDHKKFAEQCKGEEIFKINLYPIPFADTDQEHWKKYELDKLTGLETKQAYMTWCAINRFPAFADKVREYGPKLILGCGLTFLTEFFMCFAGERGAEHINYKRLEADGNSRDLYWTSWSLEFRVH